MGVHAWCCIRFPWTMRMGSVRPVALTYAVSVFARVSMRMGMVIVVVAVVVPMRQTLQPSAVSHPQRSGGD